MPQSDPHHLPPTGRLTRRATLGSAAALAGALSVSLAGCEWGPPDQVDAPEAKKDSDQVLVDATAAAIGRRAAIVDATVAAHVALAAPLQPLTKLHAAHYTALGATAGTLEGPAVSPDAAAALTSLRSSETDLQKELAGAAGAATSGALAQTFASMAAAVAQQLATLPTTLAPANGAQ